MADLVQQQESATDKDFELVVIGSGAVSHMPDFRKITGYQGVLVTDQEREAYKFLGFPDGIFSLFGLKSFSKTFSALGKGITPGSIQGNPLQLGGAIVIAPDEQVRYFYTSKEAGDDPPIDEIFAAIP